MLKEVKTKELKELLNSEKVKIIDVRSVEAYNGWKLNGEPRSGHIKSAKSLPIKWLKYLDWIEIVRHKNILPSHHIVIYAYSDADAEQVAQRFLKSGYDQIFIYKHFMDEWLPDEDLPMQQLARYSNLVSAEWIKKLISGGRPAEYANHKFVVVHAHYRNRQAYLSGHIPGAIDMDTLALESPDTWNRRSPQELKEALEQHGITADTTVVLYGKYMDPNNDDEFPGSAAGDIGAIRLAFIMMYAGVKDIRVLNGGFQSWLDAGSEVSLDDVPKKPVKDFGVQIPAQSNLAVDTPQAKELIASENAELVCVRSWPEYIGEVSGYNYIEAK